MNPELELQAESGGGASLFEIALAAVAFVLFIAFITITKTKHHDPNTAVLQNRRSPR